MSENNEQPKRSWILELIGVLSAIAFFVGVFFAFRTQMNSTITRAQFDQLQMGQTITEVENQLGRPTRREPGEEDGNETLTWENSTDSAAVCTFSDGQLVKMTAMNLP